MTQSTQVDESVLRLGQQSFKQGLTSKNDNSIMGGNTSRSHISKADDPLKRSGAYKDEL